MIICCAVTCVGQAECSDGEDEKLSRCTASEDELKFCDLDKQEFPCEAGPAKTKCIPFSQVCDGAQQCTSGRDESDDICKGEVSVADTDLYRRGVRIASLACQCFVLV